MSLLPRMQTFILVEPNELYRLGLALLLRSVGCGVFPVSSGGAAVTLMYSREFCDGILMNSNLGAGVNAADAVSMIRSFSQVPILLFDATFHVRPCDSFCCESMPF